LHTPYTHTHTHTHTHKNKFKKKKLKGTSQTGGQKVIINPQYGIAHKLQDGRGNIQSVIS